MRKIDHRKTLKHLYHPSSKLPSLDDDAHAARGCYRRDWWPKPDGKCSQKWMHPCSRGCASQQLAEGMCVQFLHIGPYEGMDAALDRMLALAGEQGYSVVARNSHDIYLNDVRKTKPENLKAVMRLPVIRKNTYQEIKP